MSLSTTPTNTTAPKRRPKGFQKGDNGRRPTPEEMKAAKAAAREKRKAQREALLATLASAPDYAVLTFKEWLILCGLSKDTVRKMGPDAPRFVLLSKQIKGITVGEHKRWLASRTKG